MEIRVEAGTELAPLLTEGACLLLGPGRHRAGFSLESSVTLRGEPGAVLVGEGRPVLSVEADDLEIRLEGLELREGTGEAAGGLVLMGYSRLELRHCRFLENLPKKGGATGGIYASRGELLLEDCAGENPKGELMVTGVATVKASRCTFGGSLALREGATLELESCAVTGVLSARGTTTRAPTLRLRNTPLPGGLRNDPELPATIELLP